MTAPSDGTRVDAPERVYLWLGPQWRAVEGDSLPWSAWPEADPNGGSVEYVRSGQHDALCARVRELEALVQSAYREGFNAAFGVTHLSHPRERNATKQWEDSEARAALAPSQPEAANG